jgi:hypothetical protein
MFGLPLVICLSLNIQVVNLNNGVVLFEAVRRDSVKDCIVMKTSEQNTPLTTLFTYRQDFIRPHSFPYMGKER